MTKGPAEWRGLYLIVNIVGATLGRPPNNTVFRILRRIISLLSPSGDGFCESKIHGRPRVAPTDAFRHTEKGPPSGGPLCYPSESFSSAFGSVSSTVPRVSFTMPSLWNQRSIRVTTSRAVPM